MQQVTGTRKGTSARKIRKREGPKFRLAGLISFPVVAAVFFVLFSIYLWLRVEPALEYQLGIRPFSADAFFFQSFVGQPGGLAEYAEAFLTELNRVSWLGALVWTLLAGVGFVGVRGLLSGSTMIKGLAPFAAGFLLLLLRNGYEMAAFGPVIGWVAAVILAWIYYEFRILRSDVRVIFGWMITAALFYAAGFWPSALFVVLAAIWEVGKRKQIPTAAGVSLALLGALVGIAWWPDVAFSRLLQFWGEGTGRSVLLCLYLLPAVCAGAMLLEWEFLSECNQRKRQLAFALFFIGWGACWFSFDRERKEAAAIDYHASRDEHAQVLQAASRAKTLDAAAGIRVHRALYHQGRLLDELFSYNQQSAWELLPWLSFSLGVCRPQSELLLELGEVSMAEHFAHEALEWEGDRPELLRLLAIINILKNRPEAARVFLNVLAKRPWQRAWAVRMLDGLDKDPELTDAPEVARLRVVKVATDQPHNKLSAEEVMQHVLQSKPDHRMAFEYLIAHYLLTRQLDKVAAEATRLSTLKSVGIPRHLEEAMLLYSKLTGEAVDIGGGQISAETRTKFEQLWARLAGRKPESESGREVLVNEFGTTYWCYFYLPERRSAPTAINSTESQ